MSSNRRRLVVKTVAATLAACALLGAAGGLIVLKSGWYHVGSTNQHFQLTHSVLEQGMRESVAFHARDVAVPKDLDSAPRIRRGAIVYRDNCLQCHGGPGTAPHGLARSMQPVPGPLVDAARHWPAAHLYWITRHGIKMSGMPAWEFHLSDDALWSVTAFMRRLPALSAPAFKETMAAPVVPVAPADVAQPALARTRGDAARGRIALTQYACNACHIIPGVTGSRVYVGRPLQGLAGQKYIAGVLPTSQANLVRWIRDPQSVDPQAAMPRLDVSYADALDISAYLLAQ